MHTSSNHSVQPKDGQFGGGLLPVVATAGVIMVMVQGSLFYQAKSSSRFLNEERNKIMAHQVAEAGVENTIADLGSRRVQVNPHMENYAVAVAKPVGQGAFSTHLTTRGMGVEGDTVDLTSLGEVENRNRSIQAKLKLRNTYDTNQVILAMSEPETTLTVTSVLKYDTTVTTTVQDPLAMPALNTTAAYAACMASGSNKCDICHLTHSDVNSRFVIDVAKPAMHHHIAHHGDYVTTDGTCDIYEPKTVLNVTPRMAFDTTLNIATTITYDTTMAIDTVVKVNILSWR